MRSEWKRILAVGALGALLALTPAAYAQSSETGAAEGLTAQEMSDLELSDEQKSQIQTIHQSRREQIKAVAQNKSLTGEQKAARIREINNRSHQRIRGLLNPEQQARFDRRRRDRREDVRDRRENRRDRREDVRDNREDRRDRREDARDARHDGGARDRAEDRRDRKEDVRDRREDRRDRRTPPPPRPKRQ